MLENINLDTLKASFHDLSVSDLNTSLRVMSVCARGLYAGGCLYVNIVEVPANLQNKPLTALQNWRYSSKKAEGALADVHSVSSLAAASSYLLTRNTDRSDWPLLIAALVGELVDPVLMIFVSSLEKELRSKEIVEKKDDDYVVQQLHKWNSFQKLKTIFAVGTFGFMLYRVATGPS